jgi:hypothetical protein
MKPTPEQIGAALHAWKHTIEQADQRMQPAIDALGLPPESPPWVAVQELQTSLTVMTAAYVGDRDNWLEWFWVEKDMGCNAMEAGTSDDNVRPIKTLADLRWLLEIRS